MSSGPRPADICCVLVPFCLGLMSKAMIITLPFVLLLLDVWPLRRISLARSDAAGKPEAKRPDSTTAAKSSAGIFGKRHRFSRFRPHVGRDLHGSAKRGSRCFDGLDSFRHTSRQRAHFLHRLSRADGLAVQAVRVLSVSDRPAWLARSIGAGLCVGGNFDPGAASCSVVCHIWQSDGSGIWALWFRSSDWSKSACRHEQTGTPTFR